MLLDYYWNLTPLGAGEGITDLQSLLTFVFGSTPGPTGRPVSMLTFLIDALALSSKRRSDFHFCLFRPACFFGTTRPCPGSTRALIPGLPGSEADHKAGKSCRQCRQVRRWLDLPRKIARGGKRWPSIAGSNLPEIERLEQEYKGLLQAQ